MLPRSRWLATRRQVFERDGWRCVKCGKAGRLECDHIKPLHRGGDPWALDNLQALCRPCHIEKTREERRGLPIPGARSWRAFLASMVE